MSSRLKRWVHVSFTLPDDVRVSQIEETFNKAAYWMRYSKNCWLLYTRLDLDTWRDRVLAVPGMGNESVFVIEFDLDKQATGWLPEWMWKEFRNRA
jgi:hypothetical protein